MYSAATDDYRTVAGRVPKKKVDVIQIQECENKGKQGEKDALIRSFS